MSTNERETRTKMRTEGKTEMQRLLKGNRYLWEQSRAEKKTQRGRGRVCRVLLKMLVVTNGAGWSSARFQILL